MRRFTSDRAVALAPQLGDTGEVAVYAMGTAATIGMVAAIGGVAGAGVGYLLDVPAGKGALVGVGATGLGIVGALVLSVVLAKKKER